MTKSDGHPPAHGSDPIVGSQRVPRPFVRGLLLVVLMTAAAAGLLVAGFGGSAYLFALIGLSDSQPPIVPFLVGLYGPPLGLLAVITLSLYGLIFHSNRASIAAAAVALLVGSAIAVVPGSRLPFQMGAQVLSNILPARWQTVNFPLRVREEGRIKGFEGAMAMAWSPDTSRLAAMSGDTVTTIAVWDRAGARLSRFEADLGFNHGNAIAFVSGASQLLLPASRNDDSNDAALGLYDANTGRIVRTIDGPEPGAAFKNRARSFAVSPDQRLAAFDLDFLVNLHSPDKPTIAVLRTSDWKITNAYPMPEGTTALAMFGDGHELIAGSFEGTIKVWNPTSSSTPRTFTVFPSQDDRVIVDTVAGSPDGRLVFVSGTSYSNARPVVLRVADGVPVATFPYAGSQRVQQAAWDPKGRYVAILTSGNDLILWTPGTPTPSYAKIRLPGSNTATSFAISPDGAHIAASPGDGIIIFSVT